MSFIGKNIKKIRTVKKLSQAAFAELFELARPSVGAYEEGRSEPKIDTLVQISRHFGLSIDLLLTKELTVNELYGFDIFKRDYTKADSLKKVATLTESTDTGTVVVQERHTFEYIANHSNHTFLQQLPVVNLPVNSHKTSRAFEVNTSELQYQQNGIRPGDILLCEAVDKSARATLQPGVLYAAVTQGKIILRRLAHIDTNDALHFKADNPDYATTAVALDDILELWQAVGVYSTHLNPPAMLDARLAKLEQTVQQLSQQVNELSR